VLDIGLWFVTVLTFVAWTVSPAKWAWAAGGAYVVDDAEVGPAGECKADSWASLSDQRDQVFVAAPACVFAGLPTVEWGLQLQHMREAGVHDNALGAHAKIALLPIEQFGLGIALTAGLGYGLRDDRLTGGFVNLPATLEPIEDLRVNVNLGWRHDETGQRDFATWGIGAEWRVTAGLTMIGEVFGENEGQPGWQAGPRLSLLDGAVDLDLIAGQNIAGLRGDWITHGVTARF
jgi:hypothetical protein